MSYDNLLMPIGWIGLGLTIIVNYITVVESMCHMLKEEDTGELRADDNSLLRTVQVPNQTIPSRKV